MAVQDDPLAFDRDLSRALPTARRLARELASSGAEEHGEALRATLHTVGSRQRLERIQELPDDDPLRQPLLRWTTVAIEWRVNAHARGAVFRAYRQQRHLIEEPRPGAYCLADMLGFALSSETERREWLAAFARSAEPLADAVSVYWDRWRELGERLAPLKLPWGAGVEVQPQAWLDQSRDAYESLKLRDLTTLLTQSLGADIVAGWPAQLTWRSLERWFRSGGLLTGLTLDPGQPPRALGASSFLRALARLGAAFADASAPSSPCFCLGSEPLGLGRREHGALFALLPLGGDFARRQLDVPRGRLADYRRGVARLLLLGSRLAAVREALRSAAARSASAFRDAYATTLPEALGFELHRGLTSAWLRPEVDAAERHVGALLAATHYLVLRERHDEDFHRNPRAIEELRHVASIPRPSQVTPDDLLRGQSALARLLGEALD